MVTHDAVGMREHGPVLTELSVGSADKVAMGTAMVIGGHPATGDLAEGLEFSHSYPDHIGGSGARRDGHCGE